CPNLEKHNTVGVGEGHVLNHSSKGCASTSSKQLANMTDLSAFPQQLCEYFGGNSKGAVRYSFPQEKYDKLPAVFDGILMLESMNTDQKVSIKSEKRHKYTRIDVLIFFLGRRKNSAMPYIYNAWELRLTCSKSTEHFVTVIDTPSIKTKQEISIFTADGDDVISVEGVFSRRAIIGNLIKVDNPLSDGSFQVEMKLPESIVEKSSISVEVEAGIITVT
ncbi:3784_t:CDS:2, partial [Ambispora leptoticha]